MSPQEINALLERVPTDDHSQRVTFALLTSYRCYGLELARLGLPTEVVAAMLAELREGLASALEVVIAGGAVNPPAPAPAD